MKNWEKQVNVYREGQRILERQRFQFPSGWLHVDNIEGEWGAFNEIIKRKDRYVKLFVQNFTTRWRMIISQLIFCSFQPQWRPL